MNTATFISVVVPTRNRQDRLNDLLKGLFTQSLSQDFWELIVVDNASTDQTKTILVDWKSQLKNLKLAEEFQIGSNFSRNRGLSASSGDLIVFLDDDTIPHPQWLERIYDRYSTLNCSTDCLGGSVLLQIECALPAWYGSFLEKYLSLTHWGTSFTSIEAQKLCSANLVIPAPLLKKLGGFDLRINRKTSNLRSNDETLTLFQLASTGAHFFYDPMIKVFHQIGPERLTQRYFRRRAWWQGRSDAEMELYLSGKQHLFKNVIWPNFYQLIHQPKLIWLAIRPCRGPSKFKLALDGQLLMGRIWGGIMAFCYKSLTFKIKKYL